MRPSKGDFVSRTLFYVMTSVLLAACAGGKAVQVDCDGLLTLINPPIAKSEGATAPERARARRKAEARKP